MLAVFLFICCFLFVFVFKTSHETAKKNYSKSRMRKHQDQYVDYC